MATQVPDQDPRNQYTATAGQTVFPYTFLIYESDSLDVVQNNVTLQLGIDYTVSGVGNENGGNVTLLNPAAQDDFITITRNMDFDRETDYQDSGQFLAETVNIDFNRLWLAAQQLRSSSGLNMSLDPNDDLSGINIPFYLPLKSVRAGQALGFDASGNPTAVPILQAGTSDANFVFYTTLDGGTISVQAGIANLETALRSYNIVGTDTGTADNYEIQFSLGLESLQYLPGERVTFIPNDANTTTTPVMKVSNLPNRNMKNIDGSNLPVGFIDPSRGYYTFIYDGSEFLFEDCTTAFGDNVEIPTIEFSDLPSGTEGNYLVYDNTGTLSESTQPYRDWVNFFSQELTSGTSLEVPDIPSSATKIEIMFNSVTAGSTFVDMQIGYGSAPITYVTDLSAYLGTYYQVSAAGDANIVWTGAAKTVVSPDSAGRSHATINLSKFNDGSDTWFIDSSSVFDAGTNEFITKSMGRVDSAFLPAPLSALKFDTGAAFTGGFVSVNVYCNEDV